MASGSEDGGGGGGGGPSDAWAVSFRFFPRLYASSRVIWPGVRSAFFRSAFFRFGGGAGFAFFGSDAGRFLDSKSGARGFLVGGAVGCAATRDWGTGAARGTGGPRGPEGGSGSGASTGGADVARGGASLAGANSMAAHRGACSGSAAGACGAAGSANTTVAGVQPIKTPSFARTVASCRPLASILSRERRAFARFSSATSSVTACRPPAARACSIGLLAQLQRSGS
ncbi:unnamed protein product [Pelagomonas calceolata]|uniref:Uncharacterized protein n=1 Tax=Pelagomonas calceolata TaxID=35677 RepID=A0A8J2WT70_9STRA|nr:unnamed protein product [Pelagomonas calceolata]